MKRAFTLIELLVFMTIFSLVIVSLISIFVSMVNLQGNQGAVAAVNQESQFLLQQIQYSIENAQIVDMPQDAAESTLILREANTTQDPTYISLLNGIVSLQAGLNNPVQPLNSNAVTVSNLSFTRHFNLNGNSSAYGTDSVSFSFTVSATSTNNKAYVENFQSAATLFAPVGRVALIQQASNALAESNVSSITQIYTTNNDAGDLLVAVVANVSSSPISISDTASNTWALIASTSYPAYNQQVTVFDALNSVNSVNTVTANFSSTVTDPTLYLYEFRGASTSSSFDASSSQLQPSTLNPSSGYANPTSTAELLLGITYNGNTAEIPAPEPGFVLETSSTLSQVYTEMSTQYITGPVAATWQYSSLTPSSSALIVTFK